MNKTGPGGGGGAGGGWGAPPGGGHGGCCGTGGGAAHPAGWCTLGVARRAGVRRTRRVGVPWVCGTGGGSAYPPGWRTPVRAGGAGVRRTPRVGAPWVVRDGRGSAHPPGWRTPVGAGGTRVRRSPPFRAQEWVLRTRLSGQDQRDSWPSRPRDFVWGHGGQPWHSRFTSCIGSSTDGSSSEHQPFGSTPIGGSSESAEGSDCSSSIWGQITSMRWSHARPPRFLASPRQSRVQSPWGLAGRLGSVATTRRR